MHLIDKIFPIGTFGPSAHKFLVESNKIEGEEWFELPTAAATFAISQVAMTPERILKIHALHEKAFTNFHGGKSPIEFGKWRDHDVRVGSWLAPKFFEVPNLMAKYCADWLKMDSWDAYCRFEKIHPFPDLNGRVGRLLWLAKAVRESYTGRPSFLEMFHHQTLSKQ